MSEYGNALDEVRSMAASGDYLLAFDQLEKLRAGSTDTPELQHLAVLCLARSGATQNAVQLFKKLGLDRLDAAGISAGLATDIRALWARLLKDQALAAGSNREQRLAEAAAEYEKIYRESGGYYPAVNAAALWLLAGETDRSRNLARATQQALAAQSDGGGYWIAAASAECELILGDLAPFAASLARARQLAGGDYAALASTRKQLSLLCAALDVDPDILRAISAPCVVHFAGHMIGRRFAAEKAERVASAIGRQMDELGVGFGYGSLASGADILIAEELLRRGAELHVILPFDIDDFKAVSVAPAGGDWLTRFDLCLKAATSVRYSSTDRYLGDGVLFTFAFRLAVGSAILRARHLAAPLRQLVVYDGQPAEQGVAEGTANEVAVWRNLGLETTRIDPGSGLADTFSARPPLPQAKDEVGRRSLKAMIFGDFKGFSKLRDAQLPLFASHIMEILAATIDDFGTSVVHRNTWGDGLFLVVDDASTAARLALALQKAVALAPFEQLGLPAEMGLRLGCHLGPIWCLYDPIIKQVAFFGEHVSRTARIEPITPEGTIYVTEEFAALLSSVAPVDEVELDYVGRVPAAKNYGILRMYALTDRT